MQLSNTDPGARTFSLVTAFARCGRLSSARPALFVFAIPSRVAREEPTVDRSGYRRVLLPDLRKSGAASNSKRRCRIYRSEEHTAEYQHKPLTPLAPAAPAA